MSVNKSLIAKLSRISLVIAAITGLVYLALRLTIFPAETLKSLISSIYSGYLLLPEWLASQVFTLADAGVSIENHALLFQNTSDYQVTYSNFIINWPKFLLYKNLSLLTLLIIWFTIAPVKRKILFSLFFVITHLIAVTAGLYLLGVTGPRIFEFKQIFPLSPTLYGTIIIYGLCVAWILLNRHNIRITIQKLPFRSGITNRTINEAVVLVFIFIALRSFLIPFFDYRPYVIFLLRITNEVTSWFGFTGYIEGDQLIGESGALALSKHCLGFMTMFVFISFTFLTRTKDRMVNWLFILSGVVFLFIVNIIRLAAVFIVAQGDNGFQRASVHHEIYNIAIYVSIFILWVIWLELFIWKKRRRTSK